jgi:hypothetical protein
LVTDNHIMFKDIVLIELYNIPVRVDVTEYGKDARMSPEKRPAPCSKTVIILDVPGGKVHILGGHSIGHSKQKLYTYVLFRTVFTVHFQNC